MGKTVIVTEKPSVARQFAAALGVSGRGDGCIEDGRYVITWCLGHLVEMCYPEKYDPALKQWTLEALPFLPEPGDYRYEPIKESSKQFYAVKKIYHRPDISEILYAGDAGREGIYIQMLVRQEAGVREGVRERVVWIDSQTDEEIKRGIREARPVEEYGSLTDSGYARAIEDYALGINLSRLLSVRYGRTLNRLAGTSGIPISVGRVMTCVLGMVTSREAAIRDFTEETFYRPELTVHAPGGDFTAAWKPAGGAADGNGGFKGRADAQALVDGLPGTATVASAETKAEKKAAPAPFNLAELQAECSRRLKISPDEALQLAQSLYEKGLTTYPRTDARALSGAIAKVIGENIAGLAGVPEYAEYAEEILEKDPSPGLRLGKKYVDDSKVTDHYAIIPTGKTAGLEKLEGLEAEAYDMIARRFLCMFLSPAEYSATSVVLECGGERFAASAKALASPGWMELAGTAKEDGGGEPPERLAAMRSLSEGDEAPAEGSVSEGKTKPPKRYTSGSLILAMENAGTLIEDEELREQIKGCGVGTSATRAETISKLTRLGYVSLDRKTQGMRPTALGEMVRAAVEMTAPAMLDPRMTAEWERGLSLIADGRLTEEAYLKKAYAMIRDVVAAGKENDLTGELEKRLAPWAAEAKAHPIKAGSQRKPKKVALSEAAAWLDVPFDEKDEAKALGARFDGGKKCWYVPKGADAAPFARWLTDRPPAKKPPGGRRKK